MMAAMMMGGGGGEGDMASMMAAMGGEDMDDEAPPVRRRVLAALACALCFAVHPVHTEAVASVVGRADVLCGALALDDNAKRVGRALW